jgi:hypothetical protein
MRLRIADGVEGDGGRDGRGVTHPALDEVGGLLLPAAQIPKPWRRPFGQAIGPEIPARCIVPFTVRQAVTR